MKGLILFEGAEVIIENGYYDVTEVLKTHQSKNISDWKNAKQTQEYMIALSEKLNVEIYTFIKSKKGRGGGTQIHERIAIFFARWIDPRFAIACDEFIMNELTKNQIKAEEYKLKACQLERFIDKEDMNDLY